MIPELVVVCGQTFRVELVNQEESPLSKGEVLGRTSVDTGKIAIHTRGDKASLDQVRDTVLHEVLHAIVGLTGLGETLGEDEESVVGRLSIHLLDTLRRNPKLANYLFWEN